MYYANDKNGTRINATTAKPGGIYTCPACGCPLILKRGSIVAHHFAHKRVKQCDPWYSSKISPWHRKMQDKFPPSTRETKVSTSDEKEYHIADVLLRNNEKVYVFEFQHSTISSNEFIDRTRFYLDLGYNVVWFFDFQDSKRPKSFFYEDTAKESPVKHVVWPGRDRVKLFDSHDVRSLFDETMCNNGGKLHVFFYASTGLGEEKLYDYQNGYQRYMWEYINPFEREIYYIKPLFSFSDSVADFYGVLLTEEAIEKHISHLCINERDSL